MRKKLADDGFGNLIEVKTGRRPAVEVEFEIEKVCKTCSHADNSGKSNCYACWGWQPKKELIPAGAWRDIGPSVMYFKEI